MDARNLWRMRLGLFVLIFMLMIFSPRLYMDFGNNRGWLWFFWGRVSFSEQSAPTVDLVKMPQAILEFLYQAIAPSIIFTLGTVGCIKTNCNMIKIGSVTKSARILTQIAVTAFLFSAISEGLVNSLITSLINKTLFVYISQVCIFPFILYLAFISYDFPRFHALDFTQESRSSTERVPEDLKSSSLP